MAITLDIIAKEAGVGKSTVCRVLARHPNVAKNTDLKVRQTLRKLNYFPKNQGKNGGDGNSRVVGRRIMAVYNEDVGALIRKDPFFLEIFEALQKCAKANGHLLSVNSICAAEKMPLPFREFVAEHEIEGVVILGHLSVPDIKELLRAEVPIVSLEAPCYVVEVSSVIPDTIGGISSAVEHLFSLGHRRIGLVTSNALYESVLQMRFGYMRGLNMAGIAFDENLVLTYAENDKYQIATEIVRFVKESPSKPTALVLGGDIFAPELTAKAGNYGIRIPEDLSLIGLGDTIACEKCVPSLTSIWIDVPYMTTKALDMLVARIEDTTLRPEKILVPTSLIVRSSTTSPRHDESSQ